MELVDVVATGHFFDPRVGSVARKQLLKIPAHIADYLHGLGVVKYVDKALESQKKSDSTEGKGDFGDKQSASSPAAQASPKKTAKQSKKEDGQQS